MNDERRVLRHFLAALAYRTQKALRDAPPSFASFRAAGGVRTPHQILAHMDGVLGYALTFFEGGEYREPMLPDLDAETRRFHEKLEALADHLSRGTPLVGITPEAMLQGPFADAMTHVGQLAMLRRLSGSPVPPENFVHADIDPENLGPDQPPPARPDEVWREAPD